MRHRLPLIAVALLLAAAAPAPGLPGATDQTREAARRLILDNHMEAALSMTLTAVRSNLVSLLSQQTSRPAQDIAPIVDDVLMPAMQAHLGELTDAMIEIYAADYSEDELAQLSAFYATPIGAKMPRQSPVLAQQLLAAAQVWAQRVVPEAIHAHAQELRNRGLPL